MRRGSSIVVAILLVISGTVARGNAPSGLPGMPMAIPFEDTIRHRWLDKPVLAGRLLHDMEDLGRWSHSGFGATALTAERSKDGKQ